MTTPQALQTAIRALLEQPLLLEGMEGFKEVIAWRSEVTRFFANTAGWSVLAGPSAVRLYAPPAFFEAGRALEDLQNPKAPLMVIWILWFHEFLGLRLGESRQFSLSELASQIESQSKLAMTVLEHRRALVQAVNTLETLGVLRLLDANTEVWEGGETSHAGALLEFTSGAAYLISQPAVSQATSLQRAAQALLGGVCLHKSLDPEAYNALVRDADEENGVVARLENTLGWSLEIQPEYALLLRGGTPKGLAKRFSPGRGVVQAAGLLLLNTIRTEVQDKRLRNENGRLRLTHNQLYALLDTVRNQYRDKWGQQANTSTQKLLREILEDWALWGAARDDGDFVILEAILSRFEAFYFDPDKPPIERVAGRRRRKT
jgi:Protein of unknown function (DUF2398)